jgi:hypothetical protein
MHVIDAILKIIQTLGSAGCVPACGSCTGTPAMTSDTIRAIARSGSAVAALVCAMTAAPSTAQTVPQSDDVIVMRRLVTTPQPEAIAAAKAAQWMPGDWKWDQPSNTCAAAAPRTRDYSCVKAGKTVDPSLCRGQAPVDHDRLERLEGCTYSWRTTAQPGCSATQPQTISCVRSDGTPAADGSCTAGTRPAATGPEYSTCTYQWKLSQIGQWNSTCSKAAVRTDVYACERSTTPTSLGPDAMCPKGGGTVDSAPTAITTGCTFKWTYTPWVAAAGGASCSPSVAQTRTVTCQSTNGETWADSLCTDKLGAADVLSRTAADYSGCVSSVTNGNLEAGSQGWTLSGATVGLSQASKGTSGVNKTMQLLLTQDTADTAGKQVSASQTVSTVPGRTYALTFAEALDNGSGYLNGGVRIEVGTTVIAEFKTTINNVYSLNRTLNFTATGNYATIVVYNKGGVSGFTTARYTVDNFVLVPK